VAGVLIFLAGVLTGIVAVIVGIGCVLMNSMPEWGVVPKDKPRCDKSS